MGKRKQIFLGTTNPAKIAIVRAAIQGLPIKLVTLNELHILLDVTEDGRTTMDNAQKKARAYYDRTDLPTLAMDGGLQIEKFPAEKQPGVLVRRIHGGNGHATEQEVLDYYIAELIKVGGKNIGVWEGSVVLVLSSHEMFSGTYSFTTLLTTHSRGVVAPGSPLSSIMIDPISGKYFSEMQWGERPDTVWIHQFLQEHLSLW